MYTGILLPNELIIFKSIQIGLWSLRNGPNEEYQIVVGVKEEETKIPSIFFLPQLHVGYRADFGYFLNITSFNSTVSNRE